MKNILPAFILGLVVVPFFFNSCQSGFQAQHSLNASLAATSCKVVLQEGGQQKLTHSYFNQPGPFSFSKVRLERGENSSGMQKMSSSVVPRGSDLTAIYNNICLREEKEMDETKLWSLISPDFSLLPSPELINQAYSVSLERDYEVSELENLANNDSCLVGVSWNEKYEVQSTTNTFSDPESYKQGHLPNIRALESYSKAFGSPTLGPTLTKAVKVAVIDTGVDWQHPDLNGNFWVHKQGWGFDATTIDSTLINYNPFDVSSNGHGTHIAGLVGAVSNNSLGVIGTMPFNAKIMAIKIFKINNDSLETNSTYLYNGLQLAVLNGAEVINLSLMATGSAYDAALESGISDALDRGIFVSAAMGNGNPGALVDGNSLYVVPAMFATRSGVVAVGSYDSITNQKSEFSHYSTTYAEISAPGAEQGLSNGIYSTIPTALGSYGRLAGTSQSTGIVSGAAALTISLIKRAYGNSPSPSEVERLLLQSANKNSSLAGYFKDGNQLDMANLVDLIHQDYPLTKISDSTADPTPCL